MKSTLSDLLTHEVSSGEEIQVRTQPLLIWMLMNSHVFPSPSVTADLLSYFSSKHPSVALERKGKSILHVNTVLRRLFNVFIYFQS